MEKYPERLRVRIFFCTFAAAKVWNDENERKEIEIRSVGDTGCGSSAGGHFVYDVLHESCGDPR